MTAPLLAAPRTTAVERAAWGIGLLALWAVGYFSLGYINLGYFSLGDISLNRVSPNELGFGNISHGMASAHSQASVHADAARAHDLLIPFDDALPFIGWMVWIYLAGLLLMTAPLFVLQAPLLRRTALSYAGVIAASLACFALFPTLSVRQRAAADPAGLDAASAWALRMLHQIDPPTNLFPSLHVSLCTLATRALAEARPHGAPLWYACLALVALSTCTVKQHGLADVLGGLVLALIIGRWLR